MPRRLVALGDVPGRAEAPARAGECEPRPPLPSLPLSGAGPGLVSAASLAAPPLRPVTQRRRAGRGGGGGGAGQGRAGLGARGPQGVGSKGVGGSVGASKWGKARVEGADLEDGSEGWGQGGEMRGVRQVWGWGLGRRSVGVYLHPVTRPPAAGGAARRACRKASPSPWALAAARTPSLSCPRRVRGWRQCLRR